MTAIKTIDARFVRIPARTAYQMGAMESGAQAALSLIVRLETEDGTIGWGETFLTPGWYAPDTPWGMMFAIKMAFAPKLIGVDVFDLETIEQRIDAAWTLGNLLAKSALDIAVRDAAAKTIGKPLCALLGGTWRKRFALSAGIGQDAPEEMARTALAFKERGFRTIKLKIGSPDDLALDVARVRAVREAIGPDLRLRLDGNGVFTVTGAVRLCRQIDQFDIEHIEQPVAGHDLKGMAEIRRAIDIPLMADESAHTMQDILAIIELRAADVVKLKVSKNGGLGPSRRMADMCHAAGIEVTVGNGFNSSILATAELQLACSCAAITPAGEFIGPDKLLDDLCDAPMTIEAGEAVLPEGPGLGITVNEEKLKKYAVSLGL